MLIEFCSLYELIPPWILKINPKRELGDATGHHQLTNITFIHENIYVQLIKSPYF